MVVDEKGLALVLSGGVARAANQVGFLRCLVRYRIHQQKGL